MCGLISGHTTAKSIDPGVRKHVGHSKLVQIRPWSCQTGHRAGSRRGRQQSNVAPGRCWTCVRVTKWRSCRRWWARYRRWAEGAWTRLTVDSDTFHRVDISQSLVHQTYCHHLTTHRCKQPIDAVEWQTDTVCAVDEISRKLKTTFYAVLFSYFLSSALFFLFILFTCIEDIAETNPANGIIFSWCFDFDLWFLIPKTNYWENPVIIHQCVYHWYLENNTTDALWDENQS